MGIHCLSRIYEYFFQKMTAFGFQCFESLSAQIINIKSNAEELNRTNEGATFVNKFACHQTDFAINQLLSDKSIGHLVGIKMAALHLH